MEDFRLPEAQYPAWKETVNYHALKEEQKRLAAKIVLSDDFDKAEHIGGVDQVYTENRIISAAVVIDAKTGNILEKRTGIAKPIMPYIPGFLSYREGPIIVETINKLETKPDVLFVDGNGILHHRRFGLACHVGLMLDIPTIGVAKKLLVGDVHDDTIYIQKEAVGRAIHTREHAKPIYVSPGHRISLKTAIELTRETLTGYKLPLPLQLAHKWAAKYKRKYLKGNAR